METTLTPLYSFGLNFLYMSQAIRIGHHGVLVGMRHVQQGRHGIALGPEGGVVQPHVCHTAQNAFYGVFVAEQSRAVHALDPSPCRWCAFGSSRSISLEAAPGVAGLGCGTDRMMSTSALAARASIWTNRKETETANIKIKSRNILILNPP